MKIERIDHLNLTVADIDRSLEFYKRVLGMEAKSMGEGRAALQFGQQKIHLDAAGSAMAMGGEKRMPAHICFITEAPVADVLAHLEHCGVPVRMGQVRALARSAPSNRSTSMTRIRTRSRYRATEPYSGWERAFPSFSENNAANEVGRSEHVERRKPNVLFQRVSLVGGCPAKVTSPDHCCRSSLVAGTVLHAPKLTQPERGCNGEVGPVVDIQNSGRAAHNGHLSCYTAAWKIG